MLTVELRDSDTHLTPAQIQDGCCMTLIFSYAFLVEDRGTQMLSIAFVCLWLNLVFLMRPTFFRACDYRPNSDDSVLTTGGKIPPILAELNSPDGILCRR